MKMCVVDDEREVRISIIQKLAALFPQEQIFDVGFGRMALEQIDLVQPELVFLDIRMPEMDGIEILHRLKEANPRIHVVIISGYDDFEYARKALQHGATDYLLKPADRGQLREMVEKVRKHLQSSFDKELELLLSQTPDARDVLRNIRPGNLSLWFDERQWKTVMIGSKSGFPPDIQQIAPQDIMLTFTLHPGMDGVVIREAFGEGKGCFREKEAFLGTLLREVQRRKASRFFQTEGSEPEIRGREPKGGVKQASKIRQELVHYARAGEYAELERCLSVWFTSLEHAGYEELQKECAHLMALLDEGLSKPEVIVLEEDTLYYWRSWVSHISTWDELKAKIKKIVLGGVQALKSLEQQANQEISGSHHWFQQALQLIEASNDPSCSLDSIAEAVGVHPVTLSRMFKLQMGMNFVRYLTRKRMQLARQLLLHTNRKINEISEEVGYADYPYFRHVFKKEFGQSPSELRRSHGLAAE